MKKNSKLWRHLLIRLTKQTDIDQLKNIWKIVFGDEDKYINGYFEHVFNPDNSWCYEDNGTLGAMLYTIPCRIRITDNEYASAYYFYALATLEKYRKQGIMGQMIEKSTAHIESAGCNNMFLIPANDKLISYYKKYGFCTTYGINGYTINGDLSLKETDPEHMSQLIEANWKYTNVNIMFDSKVHLFYLNDLALYSDFSMCELLDDNKSVGYAICRKINGKNMALQYGTNDEKIARLFCKNTNEENNAKVITARGGGNFALLNGLIPV